MIVYHATGAYGWRYMALDFLDLAFK